MWIHKQTNGEEEMINQTIESLKSIVSRILKRDERARDDDLWLYLQVLKEQGHKIFIDWDELSVMPRPESVSRIRRTIQNEEQLFTPSDETFEKRKKNCNESKEYYSNLNKNSQFCY
jgi:hypothetical protein